MNEMFSSASVYLHYQWRTQDLFFKGGVLQLHVDAGGGGRGVIIPKQKLSQFPRHMVWVFLYMTDLSDKQARKPKMEPRAGWGGGGGGV